MGFGLGVCGLAPCVNPVKIHSLKPLHEAIYGTILKIVCTGGAIIHLQGIVESSPTPESGVRVEIAAVGVRKLIVAVSCPGDV